MLKNYNLLLSFCFLVISSCNYETKKLPVKEAYSYLTKQGITQENIKAIVLQDKNGNFHLIEDQNEFSSVIEGFIELENSDCRRMNNELSKWTENFGTESFEPFEYHDEFLSGDIVTEYRDKIVTIGFIYCKESPTNLGEFIKKSIKVKRIDSLYKRDSNYSTILNDSSNFLLHKPIETGDKILMSYYRKVK